MPALSPAPAPRRGCSSGCCCCCLWFLLVVVLLAGLCILVWLIDRPGYISATAVSATLSRFDLADGPSGGGTLQHNLTVDIRVRNRKTFGIHIDYAEAQASYAGERFVGYDLVEPFYQKKKSERTITAAFHGSSPIDNGDAVSTYRRERSEGFYFVKLELFSDLRYDYGEYSNWKSKSKISCTLRLPVPNTSTTPVTTQLGTTCDAGHS